MTASVDVPMRVEGNSQDPPPLDEELQVIVYTEKENQLFSRTNPDSFSKPKRPALHTYTYERYYIGSQIPELRMHGDLPVIPEHEAETGIPGSHRLSSQTS